MDDENKYTQNAIISCEAIKNENNISANNINNPNEIINNKIDKTENEEGACRNEGVLVNLYKKFFKPKKTNTQYCSNKLGNNNENTNENNVLLNTLDEPKIDTKEKKKSGFGFLHKVLQNKNSKIIALIATGCLILLIMLNAYTSFTKSSSNNNTFNNLNYISSSSYTKELESKLIRVLSKVKGAGSVDVMVTLESGPELKIAMSVDKKTNTVVNGDNTTTNITVVETPIIITQNGESKPLVLMEIMPKIKGVIIVSQGADNVKIKLELLQAVQAILGVNGNNIQIHAGI